MGAAGLFSFCMVMRFSFLLILLFLFFVPAVYAARPKAPSHLRTCDKVKPAGTVASPFFGWHINDPDDNEIQTAYQVMVATSEAILKSGHADIWDSGMTASRMQNYIGFNGTALSAGTRYYWKVRTWDKDGNISPYSATTYFDVGLSKASDWNGAMWIKRDTKDANDYTCYRKAVDLGTKQVKRAMVYVTAFHHYALYINGTVVGKGPAYHYPQYAYYNAYDVTEYLRPQTILGAMTHWYGGGQGRPKGERGFLLKLVVDYADGTTSVMGTDKTWKQSAMLAFDPGTKSRNGGEGVGYVDVIDSRKEMEDWYMPDFDDVAWQDATVLGPHPTAPFTGELQADLTRLKEKKIRPVVVKHLGKGTYVIDLGKIYAGVPEIIFAGGTAGDTVKMYGGYVLKDDGTVSERINQHTDLSYRFVLNGKEAVFKPVVYLGYRYLQVNNSPVALTIDNVSFITRYFELDPGKARFTSSDEMLNAVWSLMTHSLTLGAQEGFVDTPTREKGQFLGDAWTQGVSAMSTMGERALNYRILLEFLDSQDQYWPDGRLNAVYPNGDGKRDIPDYTQQYLLWAWDYYMHTGNLQFLKSNYARLKKIGTYVDSYTNPATGLVHNLAGGSGEYRYGIIDWPASMRYGYDMRAEARTVINAYAYADFDILSRIAGVTGHTADAEGFSAKAAGLKQAFNKKFVNAEGVYTDGLLASGVQSTHVSQHANMFPLALGMVPEMNRKAVTDAVKERKMSAGMVTVRFLPQSIGEAGEAGHLLELYTNPQWDGWAQTISRGGTATWEAWDALEQNYSMSHPWGAAGLLGIQQYILGVKLLKPQHELIQVKPLDFEGKLTSASGTIPTDKGDIEVEWNRGSKIYTLTLTAPDNVTADVYIPKGDSASNTVKVDGRPVPAKEAGDFLLIENVGSGKHVFEKAL